MQIFPHCKTFFVRRIKKVKDGYLLVLKDRKEPSVFVSKADCASALDAFASPLFSSLAHIVDISYIRDMIVKIEVDAKVVFKKKFEEYPQYYQDYWNEIKAKNRAYDEALKTKLEAYLENFKSVDILRIEDEISKLPADFKVYIGLHLYEASKASPERLELMLKICQMAERIYKRHTKPDDWSKILNSLTFVGCLALGFRADMQKYVEMPECAAVFEEYREAQALVKVLLPPIEDTDVERYICYLVCDVLQAHACDLSKIAAHATRDGWNHSRIYSDLEEIERQIDDMKMPFLTSFVLPDVFSKEDVKNLLSRYSLR